MVLWLGALLSAEYHFKVLPNSRGNTGTLVLWVRIPPSW